MEFKDYVAQILTESNYDDCAIKFEDMYDKGILILTLKNVDLERNFDTNYLSLHKSSKVQIADNRTGKDITKQKLGEVLDSYDYEDRNPKLKKEIKLDKIEVSKIHSKEIDQNDDSYYADIDITNFYQTPIMENNVPDKLCNLINKSIGDIYLKFIDQKALTEEYADMVFEEVFE